MKGSDLTEKFRKIHRKYFFCRRLFYQRVAGCEPETLLKRDACTSVSLQISQVFSELPSCRTPVNDCF